MTVNIGDGLSYPAKDPQWVTKCLIGTVCAFFSFLLLPALAMAGYGLETMRMTSEGENNRMPEWGQFGDYLWRGLMTSVISFLYLLIPGCFMIAGFGGAIIGMLGGAARESVALGAGGATVGLALGGVGTVLLAVFSFFLPMAILRYGRTLQMGEAFNVGGVIGDIMKSPVDYLMCWLVPGVVSFICNSVLGFTGIGLVLSPAVIFYTTILGGQLLGQYYRAHLDH
jgi:hypothetical protein